MTTTAPGRIVIASGNRGKLAEFAELLEGWHCEVVPQSELGVIPAEETGDSFIGECPAQGPRGGAPVPAAGYRR